VAILASFRFLHSLHIHSIVLCMVRSGPLGLEATVIQKPTHGTSKTRFCCYGFCFDRESTVPVPGTGTDVYVLVVRKKRASEHNGVSELWDCRTATGTVRTSYVHTSTKTRAFWLRHCSHQKYQCSINYYTRAWVLRAYIRY